MHEIKQKLASSKGETIAEVMVASLIAGLGLLLLASMIMSASHIITRSEKTMKAYYTSISEIEQEKNKDGNVNVTIDRAAGKENITFGTGIWQYTARDSDENIVLRSYAQSTE